MNKYLIIDFDSTIVKVETLDELAKIALEGNEKRDEIVREIVKTTNLGMEGKITFSESLERRIKLISTHKDTVDEVSKYFLNQITDSVLENLDFFRENSDHIYIISGGFCELIAPVAEMMGIKRENILANNFAFDEKGFLCGVDTENLMAKDKGKINQIRSLNLDKKVFMIGDGWTDCETKECEEVEKFIAFTENIHRDNVVENADAVAESFDEVIEIISK
ncbi:HAD-IB family phosphatase [Patescibacteria group bacterium]